MSRLWAFFASSSHSFLFFFFFLQNSIKFVKQVALEDETKLKGIPPEDCSKIMLWRLNLPTSKSPSYQENQEDKIV
jgi:hypothetical protein